MISDYLEHTISVAWLWEQECQSSFVCETMTGNPCGDYGVKLAHRSSNQSVCHAGHKYHGILKYNEVLNISVWHTDDAKFEASCFLWRTENGDLPNDISGTSVNLDLITAIVRNQYLVEHTIQVIKKYIPFSLMELRSPDP